MGQGGGAERELKIILFNLAVLTLPKKKNKSDS